jgi:hypothetical protein
MVPHPPTAVIRWRRHGLGRPQLDAPLLNRHAALQVPMAPVLLTRDPESLGTYNSCSSKGCKSCG